MGRKSKVINGVTKSIRFPLAYIEVWQKLVDDGIDMEFSDWVRFEELGLNPDGSKKNGLNKKISPNIYKNILTKLMPTFVKSGEDVKTITDYEEELIMEIVTELQSKGEI